MEETNINKVKIHAKVAYGGKSRNYKQKLLYGLLAAVRNSDRDKFLNILYTNLNAMNKGETQKSLVDNLMAEYENVRGPHFETYAYAIIAGILASNDNEMSQKNTQEVEENE